MAVNELKVNQQHAIVALYQQGRSKRKIARELGVDRSAVRRYLAGIDSKPPTNPRTGVLALGGAGPDSLCEPWKESIQAALAAGLSIQRVYQDLVAEHQFAGSYDSVWRFVRRLETGLALPFRRMEVEPGAQLQVDFGQGAWVIEHGKRRRPHLFRGVLGQPQGIYTACLPNNSAWTFLGAIARVGCTVLEGM